MNKLATALIAALVLFASPISAEDKAKQAKLGDLDCSTNQIAKFSGTEWICAEDRTGPASNTFDLILIDSETDQQVGVAGAGGEMFRLDMVDGVSQSVQPSYGYVDQLPEIGTNSETITLWLRYVLAYYSCDDLSLLGWVSEWRTDVRIDGRFQSQLPDPFFETSDQQMFGALTNGDVVLATVSDEASIVWHDNYAGIWGLDKSEPFPESDLIYSTCVILADAENQCIECGPSWDFYMTPMVTLAEIGQYSPQPSRVWAADRYSTEASNALQLCNTVAPNGCEITGNGEPSYFTLNPLFKSATYTRTNAVVSVTVDGEVPGNRGEPRTFERVWR